MWCPLCSDWQRSGKLKGSWKSLSTFQEKWKTGENDLNTVQLPGRSRLVKGLLGRSSNWPHLMVTWKLPPYTGALFILLISKCKLYTRWQLIHLGWIVAPVKWASVYCKKKKKQTKIRLQLSLSGKQCSSLNPRQTWNSQKTLDPTCWTEECMRLGYRSYSSFLVSSLLATSNRISRMT